MQVLVHNGFGQGEAIGDLLGRQAAASPQQTFALARREPDARWLVRCVVGPGEAVVEELCSEMQQRTKALSMPQPGLVAGVATEDSEIAVARRVAIAQGEYHERADAELVREAQAVGILCL